MITIFNDRKKALDYSNIIHEWLKKNRKGYNAERWSDIDLSKSDKAEEYYVKVPPDYEKLNEKLSGKNKLIVSKDAIRTCEKLPQDWKNIEEEVIKPK